MKFLISISLLFSAIVSSPGQIRLSASHAAPRVGQEFTIELHGDILSDYIDKKFPSGLDAKSIGGRNIFKLERAAMPTKIGAMVIGPYKFRINGKRYLTNSITLDIHPPLPAAPGLWIRIVDKDNDRMLLIEQIVATEPVRTFSSNGTGISWSTSEDSFVAFVEETEFDGITFVPWGSGYGQKPNKLIEWPSGLTYSYRYYKIKKSSKFTGPVKLEAKHFNNLKSEMELPEIVIN